MTQLLSELGNVQGAGDALVVGALSEMDLVRRELKPSSIATSVDFPSPESGTSTHDFVLAFDGVASGRLGEVRDRLVALRGRLASQGRLAIVVPTLMGTAIFTTSEDSNRGHESLLFPHLAASGELGEASRNQVQLSASSWLLLVRACGLDVEAAYGFGHDGVPEPVAEEHAERLAVFDPVELQTGWLMMLLRLGGTEQ